MNNDPGMPRVRRNPPRPPMIEVGNRSLEGFAAEIRLPEASDPLVSVVIPAFNQLAYTLCCLASLARHRPAVPFEAIVVDDGSTDATPAVLPGIANLVSVRNDTNLGFVRSVNRGAAAARGRFLHLLNNDTQVQPGWLDALVAAFEDPAVGIAGSKLVYPSGHLQEAGALLHRDGTVELVGLNDDPARPEYNVAREVDHCSGASLMIRRDLFRELGGLDEAYAPAYFEDCDLSLKVRARGLKVVYVPGSVVVHHLSVSTNAAGDEFKRRRIETNRRLLLERWGTALEEQDRVRDAADRSHPLSALGPGRPEARGAAARIWEWIAGPDGLPRRIARRLGLGRLLLRLGVADPLLDRLPEGRSTAGAVPIVPGVELVGHPYGVQAVGQYLRESAAALAAAGVPFHIRNALDWGEHMREKHTDFAFWDRLTTVNPHRVNLVHVNANEMAAVRRHLGASFFDGRHTIACWHWELGRFPRAWRPALKGVDELWASSRFMQAALAEVARVPVVWMPHPVHVDPPERVARGDFGLPDDAYLFLTAFDFNSYVARKNPLGAVRAFQAAFPRGRHDRVGCVVKAAGTAERPEDARAFREAPELDDPRVVVIDELLDRRRMVALMAACDCFVSLHRAEGFGRGIAEAMLLGKPAIATGYSGNVDFTTPETACVVGYRLVPVRRDEYPHAKGQSWADPDVEQAAEYMRRLAGDRPWGAALATRGRELVAAQHGLESVGWRYRERLEDLGFL